MHWRYCSLAQSLVQDCSISIANALEILQSCTKLSVYNPALTSCASTVISPTCLINVDLPPILGPVTKTMLPSLFRVSSSSMEVSCDEQGTRSYLCVGWWHPASSDVRFKNVETRQISLRHRPMSSKAASQACEFLAKFSSKLLIIDFEKHQFLKWKFSDWLNSDQSNIQWRIDEKWLKQAHVLIIVSGIYPSDFHIHYSDKILNISC